MKRVKQEMAPTPRSIEPGNGGGSGPRALCSLGSEELVARSRGRDRAAFEELYRRYRPAVVRRLTHLLGPGSGIADLAQDCFVSAWQKLDRFRGDAPFSHWLLQITTNLARGHYRRLCRRPWQLWERPEQEAEVRGGSAIDLEASYPRLDAVHRALSGLSARLREAVVLFELEGLSLAELAQTLDVPLNTAASRVRRGRDKLKEQLSRMGYHAIPVAASGLEGASAPAAELCRGESQ